MRLSLVVCFCLLVAVAHCATTRRVATTAGRGTTKAPAKTSAYTYLRSIRGNRSCSTGTCPFWERHGRSFAALRCYSREYQDCACLHRMCFSSCLFTREVCNQEMVSCLRQICPRCMPASSLAMCSTYDSMAERVADALSVFACYPCCPSMGANQPAGSNTSVSTTAALGGLTSTVPLPTDTAANGPLGDEGTLGLEGETTTTTTTPAVPATTGLGANGSQPPVPSNGEAVPSRNQRVPATGRTTRRVVTTRRASGTTRRPATGTTAPLRSNNNKVQAAPRTTIKPGTTKKVQATTRPKS